MSLVQWLHLKRRSNGLVWMQVRVHVSLTIQHRCHRILKFVYKTSLVQKRRVDALQSLRDALVIIHAMWAASQQKLVSRTCKKLNIYQLRITLSSPSMKCLNIGTTDSTTRTICLHLTRFRFALKLLTVYSTSVKYSTQQWLVPHMLRCSPKQPRS